MADGVERADFLRALGRTLRHPVRETERLADTGPPRLPPEQVLVFGAGAAGLGAARAMAAEGVAVAVLEARQRVGGRAWTADALGVPVDLGAAFVHGTEGNPVADLAYDAGDDLVASDVGATVLLGAGGVLDDAARDAALDRYDALLAGLVAIREDLGPGASVADGVAALGDRADDDVLRLLHAEVGVAHAADLDRLALATTGRARLPGDDALATIGVGGLLATLAEDLDVRLGEEVLHVDHGGRGVRVHTTLGEYRVDRAIVALPIGVLAAGTVSFDPPLPDEVLAALQAIDPGRLTTVAARLAEPLLPSLAEFVAGPAERPGEIAAWAALDDAVGEPVLVGWAAGAAADAVLPDDDEAVQAALGALATRLGRPVPEVRWSAVARWDEDPHARGAVSFVPAGVAPAQRRALGGLLSPRLFLAGEAGASVHPGTVHGALQSGEREAARCMDLMRAEQ